MSSKAIISLVGRPNVGKSTFYNALIKKRSALVMDKEGVSRDRRYSSVFVEALNRTVEVCDTGGWMPEGWRKGREDLEILEGIETQVIQALQSSSLIVVVVDVREGFTGLDQEIVRSIRKLGKPFVIAANKADQVGKDYQLADFYSAGAEEILLVSAEHRVGIENFWLAANSYLPEQAVTEKQVERMNICIVGRPNVGKSAFLNSLLGEERSVSSAIAGTTTDPVDVHIENNGNHFTIIDTAGIRRHAKRQDDVENLSVMIAKRNLEKADLALLLVDAADGITTQDSRIASLVEESGCAVIVMANKWDLAPQEVKSQSDDSMKRFKEAMDKEWSFLGFAPIIAISAKGQKVYGSRKGTDAKEPKEPWPMPTSFSGLWDFFHYIILQREQSVPQDELTDLVEEAFSGGPRWVGHLGEFRQIHQVGNRPPQFMAFVKDANDIPEALRGYLKRSIRERYGYRGHPIRWVFKHRH
ncbi:MAG: ribosome biogenesis GTPase Der [Oligoflexia bacterium]|nr:ribosome biogenesis GTPase Der [Oligoflexia bacterium]